MDNNSSGNVNYWPGFVDAFSNLVLALVFVIVILAMSLGMFSGLMAKMAIQRALVEQRLKESQAAAAGVGPDAADAAASAAAGPERAEEPGADETGGPALAGHAVAGAGSTEKPAAVMPDDADDADLADAAPRGGQAASAGPGVTAPDAAREGADKAGQVLLRKENEALRQELAALRKKQAAQARAAPPTVSEPGAKIDSAAAPPPDTPKPDAPFGPKMPGGDPDFQRRIAADLLRVLEELSARRDSAAVIRVVIHVPNYALTENKRTALFYLISIKDYLMKKNVSPERIRMHMDPAPAGQKDMTVSMSVEH